MLTNVLIIYLWHKMYLSIWTIYNTWLHTFKLSKGGDCRSRFHQRSSESPICCPEHRTSVSEWSASSCCGTIQKSDCWYVVSKYCQGDACRTSQVLNALYTYICACYYNIWDEQSWNYINIYLYYLHLYYISMCILIITYNIMVIYWLILDDGD